MSQTDEDVDDLPTDTESEPQTEETQQAEEQFEEQTETETEELQEEVSEEPVNADEKPGYVKDEPQDEPKEEPQEDVKEVKVEADSETEIATVDAEQIEEGEEEEGEEEEGEEEEPSYYDPDDFISGPKICKGGTLPIDILDFSYGYNCRKYFNLTVLDEEIIVFASGNFINYFNVETREIWFRRSALGEALATLRKNPRPEYPYFAVAECGGRRPLIIMYEWPTMEIHCVMKGGRLNSMSIWILAPMLNSISAVVLKVLECLESLHQVVLHNYSNLANY
ncbi:hypothetical protein NQ318_010959 [Aromia moschata]|uniref:Protein kinase domain-containing protein n=1 Tax=Aromia moschata TaxID=1265417 RepID=A0AAV8YJX4_9CUCU|nr:hypothetical protein NQ318_010959 [Aromia moschata]